MKGRVYVLIFFVWAMLTIITPTLVLLSSSSSNPEDLADGVHYNQDYIKMKRSPIASSRRRIEGIMIIESDRSINKNDIGIGFWDFVSTCFKDFQGKTSEPLLSNTKRKGSLVEIVGD